MSVLMMSFFWLFHHQISTTKRGSSRGSQHHSMFSDEHSGRTPDETLNLQVPLQDIFLGNTLSIDIEKNLICERCGGVGAEDSSDVELCTLCDGRGYINVKQRLGFGFIVNTQQTCGKCGGVGEIIHKKCPVCFGRKIVRGKKLISVPIPRGIPDAYPIRIIGESDEEPGKITGDIVFYIYTFQDDSFQRSDHIHLHTNLTISLLQVIEQQAPNLSIFSFNLSLLVVTE